MKLPVTLVAAILFLAPAIAAAEPAVPESFVDAGTVVPGLAVEMAYHGRANFIGRPVSGYEEAACLLTLPAANALARAQARLRPLGLGLKVFDCYRPVRAVQDFVRWAADPKQRGRKAQHFPKVPRSELFARGYIAEKSGHSRGSTVDATIVDLASGRELAMGTRYDWFGEEAWPTNLRIAAPARAHRLLLREVMTGAGFRPLDVEWWHFTLADEPFVGRYFDFPVRRPSGQAVQAADPACP